MDLHEQTTEAPEVEPSARVLVGDAAQSLRTLSNHSAHCAITDPPYGLTSGLDVQELATAWSKGETFLSTEPVYAGTVWDNSVPGYELWSEVHRFLHPGRSVLADAASRTMGLTSLAMELAGFEVRDLIHWTYATGQIRTQDLSSQHERTYGVPCPELEGLRSTLRPGHEPIVVARKALASTTVLDSELEQHTGAIRHGSQLLSNVWHTHDLGCTPRQCVCGADCSNTCITHIYPGATVTSSSLYCAKPSRSERPETSEGVYHDTVKPLSLMRTLVRAFTKSGQTVLDPFLGSGTTAEAALLEQRQVIGCERDTTYVELIRQRLIRIGASEEPMSGDPSE